MLQLLLALMMLWGTPAGKHPYAGPKSLGPFRIDKDVPMSSLFERLGRPSRVARDAFCYRSADGHAYLVLTRMAEAYDRRAAGEVQLSDFPNCVDRPVQVTSDDLAAWKTDEGIGLGSSSEDVKKAYGRPSTEESIGTDYRGIIRGAPAHSARKPEAGTTELGYTGASDELRAAYFGIRNGKVAWIFLTKNE